MALHDIAKISDGALKMEWLLEDYPEPTHHSGDAWETASRYSSVLASETRDLAGAIDKALKEAHADGIKQGLQQQFRR